MLLGIADHGVSDGMDMSAFRDGKKAYIGTRGKRFMGRKTRMRTRLMWDMIFYIVCYLYVQCTNSMHRDHDQSLESLECLSYCIVMIVILAVSFWVISEYASRCRSLEPSTVQCILHYTEVDPGPPYAYLLST